MLDSLVHLLLHLPLGLFLASAVVEWFVASRNRKDLEPCMLWLLCCTVVTGSAGVLAGFVAYFWKADTPKLDYALWLAAACAVGTAAWGLKRMARNRGILTLSERYLLAGPGSIPQRKPGQLVLITSYRIMLTAAVGLAAYATMQLPGKIDPELLARAKARKAEREQQLAAAAVEATKKATPAFTGTEAKKTETPATTVAAAPVDESMDPTKLVVASAAEAEEAAKLAAEPLPGDPPAPPPPPGGSAAMAAPDEKGVYATVIRPMMTAHCVKCHGPEKQKGGLRLDTPAYMQEGGDEGPVLLAGAPEKSVLYTSVILPKEHDDFMPQNGDPLPDKDKQALKAWIATGADFGTGAPVVAAAKTTKAVPVVAKMEETRPVSRNSMYATKIRPIFSSQCVKCHGPKLQKGDLRLDSPDAIRAGVNGKPVIVPGKPDRSRVYAVCKLPSNDPDFMPQKGSPLSKSHMETLEKWILAGADLGDGVAIPQNGGGNFAVDKYSSDLPEPPKELLEKLKREHVLVRAISANGRVLELDFSHSERAGELRLDELKPIFVNIHTLDLSRTSASDRDVGWAGQMPNLTRLLVSRTQISDKSLEYMRGCPRLEQINLYDTPVSDAGLAHLSSNTKLLKVYAWQSKVTTAGAAALKKKIPEVVVSLGDQVITPPPPAAMTNR